ncbi:MAG: TIGR00300 family protein, partial [Nocardioidaceae bacterium]|nr:TIGR00300 family protein [Nocardioidaceae bacterium]
MNEQSNEVVEITGHLMDSGILSRVLSDIREYGGDHVIERFDLGHDAADTSYARILVSADDDESLQRMLMRLQTRGVNMVHPGEVTVSETDTD